MCHLVLMAGLGGINRNDELIVARYIGAKCKLDSIEIGLKHPASLSHCQAIVGSVMIRT